MAEQRSTDRAVLNAGERILLTDSKKRRYLVHLEDGASFHSHAGLIAHDEIIGKPEGTELRTQSNAKFLALRPTLVDHVLKMPRGAQVIYPKDLGPILIYADIFPGAKVLESGVGSGALSTTLLRAGAEVTGYEIRSEFADVARENVVSFLGPAAMDALDLSGHRWRPLRPHCSRPARTLACHRTCRGSAPTRGHFVVLHTLDCPSHAFARGPPSHFVHDDRIDRNHPARLVRQWPSREARPSDGGTHRFPYLREVSR